MNTPMLRDEHCRMPDTSSTNIPRVQRQWQKALAINLPYLMTFFSIMNVSPVEFFGHLDYYFSNEDRHWQKTVLGIVCAVLIMLYNTIRIGLEVVSGEEALFRVIGKATFLSLFTMSGDFLRFAPVKSSPGTKLIAFGSSVIADIGDNAYHLSQWNKFLSFFAQNTVPVESDFTFSYSNTFNRLRSPMRRLKPKLFARAFFHAIDDIIMIGVCISSEKMNSNERIVLISISAISFCMEWFLALPEQDPDFDHCDDDCQCDSPNKQNNPYRYYFSSVVGILLSVLYNVPMFLNASTSLNNLDNDINSSSNTTRYLWPFQKKSEEIITLAQQQPPKLIAITIPLGIGFIVCTIVNNVQLKHGLKHWPVNHKKHLDIDPGHSTMVVTPDNTSGDFEQLNTIPQVLGDQGASPSVIEPTSSRDFSSDAKLGQQCHEIEPDPLAFAKGCQDKNCKLAHPFQGVSGKHRNDSHFP